MEYFILRCCERLALSEEAFFRAGYDRQVRWLAYELLRETEEARADPSSRSD